MDTRDGKPVDHYTELKKAWRKNGEKGVNAYLKKCRKAIRRYNWSARRYNLGRRFFKLAVWLHLISTTKAEKPESPQAKFNRTGTTELKK
jgi:hypothetical protein